MSNEQEEPQEGERVTGLAAIFGPTVNAVFSPGRAFEVIGARPALVTWILIWVLVGMCAMTLLNSDVQRQFMRVGFVESMQRQGRTMDADQAARALERMDQLAPLFGLAQSLVVVLLVGVIALMLWAGSTMLGGSAKFGKALGVASVGAVIHPLLATAYISLMWWMDPPQIRRIAEIPDALPTLSLDLLLGGPGMSMLARTFLMRIDLFNIWWVILIAIGCQQLLRLRKGGAWGLGIAIWLVTAGVGALFSSLGQG